MRHLITALFLVAALALYSIGAAGPGIVFMVLGGLAELAFWLRLINRNQPKK